MDARQKVEYCLDEGYYTQAIKTLSEEAKQSGINRISAYAVGDFLIEGVQPYQFFQSAVETALGKNKK